MIKVTISMRSFIQTFTLFGLICGGAPAGFAQMQKGYDGDATPDVFIDRSVLENLKREGTSSPVAVEAPAQKITPPHVEHPYTPPKPHHQKPSTPKIEPPKKVTPSLKTVQKERLTIIDPAAQKRATQERKEKVSTYAAPRARKDVKPLSVPPPPPSPPVPIADNSLLNDDEALVAHIEQDDSTIRQKLMDTTIKHVPSLPTSGPQPPLASEEAPKKQPTLPPLIFKKGGTNVSPDQEAQITQHILPFILKNPNSRVQILSFATSFDHSASAAKRFALARALAVRDVLKTHHIDLSKLDIRAIVADDQPPTPDTSDRINVVLISP